MTAEVMGRFVGVAEYAAGHGSSVRTVMRWLAAGELPGAVKLDGAWSIPVDTVRVPTPEGVVTVVQDTSVGHTSGRVPWDKLAALQTCQAAAVILGHPVTAATVRRWARTGDIRSLRGPGNAYLIPLAELRAMRGE